MKRVTAGGVMSKHLRPVSYSIYVEFYSKNTTSFKMDRDKGLKSFVSFLLTLMSTLYVWKFIKSDNQFTNVWTLCI